ncbi:Hypothetical predicted protein [Pelobates cultripes]|uniref:Uncharacterized protein n=1 Tax=Pelobates cultripes TaxID=61616 RepID=A0AAD1TIH0_PELCU|nr:Hypothetical predicted protein [Pelobates cultripes]
MVDATCPPNHTEAGRNIRQFLAQAGSQNQAKQPSYQEIASSPEKGSAGRNYKTDLTIAADQAAPPTPAQEGQNKLAARGQRTPPPRLAQLASIHEDAYLSPVPPKEKPSHIVHTGCHSLPCGQLQQ